METINSAVESFINFVQNPKVQAIWFIIVALLLLWIVFKKEHFGEFRVSAPLASQLPSDLLGWGAGARASTEFSSTNQGPENVFAGKKRENMVGSMESPNVNFIPQELADDQSQTVNTAEAFSNRIMYRENMKTPDDILKGVLHGHN